MNSPQSLLVISFPDRRGKKETVYLGMFKAKILVLGPCEVTFVTQQQMYLSYAAKEHFRVILCSFLRREYEFQVSF